MRKSSGLSLIEVVVAGALFFVIFSAVLTIMPYSAAASVQAQDRILADAVASSVISDIKSRSFSSLSRTAPHTLPPVVMEGNKNFIPTVEIVNLPGYDASKLLEVRVRVSWTNSSGDKTYQKAEVLTDLVRE